jgi:quercetin dioxygenase-like cupin family protein
MHKERTMPSPVIVSAEEQRASEEGFIAEGSTIAIQLWEGSAPYELHVHHAHDIAWHLLEGSLTFRFSDSESTVGAGATVFIPAGTPHTYGIEPALLAGCEQGHVRYLVIAPPRLFELFKALEVARTGRSHTDWGKGDDPAIYAAYESELLEIPA